MGSPNTIDELLDLLRLRGGRTTVARRAILEELTGTHGHITADRLTELVRVRYPDVDRSTVYRFLEDLEALAVVEHVHLGHGAAVYHLTDDRHLHLVCQRCDAVIEVPQRDFEQIRSKLQAQYDFSIDPHHFAIPGICGSCAAQDT